MASFFVQTENVDSGASVSGSFNTYVVPSGIVLSNDGTAFRFRLGDEGNLATENVLIIDGILGAARRIAIRDTGEGGLRNAIVIGESAIVSGRIVIDGNNDDFTIDNLGIIRADVVAIEYTGQDGRFNNEGLIETGERGIDIFGDASEVNNSGTIDASISGVRVDGAFTTLTNSGTIRAEEFGVFVTNGLGTNIINTGSIITSGQDIIDFRAGVWVEGAFTTVNNTGEINGGPTGIFTAGASAYIVNDGIVTGGFANTIGGAIFAIEASLSTIINNGTATGTGLGLYGDGDGVNIINNGTTSGLDAILAVGNAFSVINTGTVMALENAVLGVADFGSEATLTNSGTIVSDDVGLNMGAADVTIVNTGTIAAQGNAIELQRGADTVRNSGLIEGDILLGAGNDTFISDTGGTVAGRVFGNSGDDTLRGSALDDVLNGGDGDDLLVGRAGNDTLFGQAGADALRGSEGDDTISGGDDDDVVNGQSGDDHLSGDDGADFIRGGAGNDVIMGGDGDDTMRGDAGADEFVIAFAEAFDRIVDFETSEDILNLSDLGFVDVADALSTASQQGNNVLFDFGAFDQLLVLNVTIASIADDIVV